MDAVAERTDILEAAIATLPHDLDAMDDAIDAMAEEDA